MHNIPDWHTQCNETVRNRIKERQNNLEKKDLNDVIENELEEYLKKKIKKEMRDEKWPCLFCDKVGFFNKEIENHKKFKMFQGEQFVFKHFKNKHEEELNKEKKEVFLKILIGF